MSSGTADGRFLVTGGTGCIGSWVVADLIQGGASVVAMARGADRSRLRLLLTEDELDAIVVVEGDVADVEGLVAIGRRHAIDHVIHLAGLQLPFCARDPYLGARVNVLGTIAVFEMAKQLGLDRVVYAGSAAVFGPASHYDTLVLGPDAEFFPTSHYGVYKVANELQARVYWEADRIASIGLRPHSVYGPGRDQGMTSKPTAAMIAAAAGRPFRVAYGGRYQFQFADDVARAFIAATRAPFEGAAAYDIGGQVTSVDDIVSAIGEIEPASRGRITVDDTRLALPEAFDGGPLTAALGPIQETALLDGVRQTIERYRAAIETGKVDDAFLDRVLA